MGKIAFVVQRYGLEVNGGAELHCRQLAEHMTRYYEVEVITTKAIDYVTWADEYETDEEIINNILVRRFSVDFPRDNAKFNKFSEKILQLNSSGEEEEQWMKMQGPYSSGLLHYLEENRDNYDVFIFFTYLYCTTYYGLPIVKDKAILIPTAHDERPIHLSIFNDRFGMPGGIFYNTELEKNFVEKRFRNENVLNNGGLGGVGVDLPEDTSAERFREKYGENRFILYIGRIEEHKGCDELFQFFARYKKRNQNDVKLVLIGREVMKLPRDKDIISLGFVDDQVKFDALAACELLILPSRFESLSMVVLEAMAMARPVIVEASCEVVKKHCTKSNGGLYYHGYYEFEGCLNYMLEHPQAGAQMGRNGQEYVRENYCWEAIEKRLADMIEKVRR